MKGVIHHDEPSPLLGRQKSRIAWCVVRKRTIMSDWSRRPLIGLNIRSMAVGRLSVGRTGGFVIFLLALFAVLMVFEK